MLETVHVGKAGTVDTKDLVKKKVAVPKPEAEPEPKLKPEKSKEAVSHDTPDYKPKKKKKKKSKSKANSGVWISVSPKDLPSRGLAIPSNTRIKYRPYNFEEIETITESKLATVDMIAYMAKGIKVVNAEKEDMTMSDILYLLTLRKLSSLGEKSFALIVNYKGQQIRHVMEPCDLEFIDLEIQALPIIVDIWDREVEFMPLTLGRYYDLMNNNNFDPNNKVHNVASMITSIPFEKALSLIKKTTDADDIKLLKAIELLLFHSLKKIDVPIYEDIPNPDYENETNPELKKIHPKTIKQLKETVTVGLDDPTVVVYPFRESKQPIDSRIRFGS